MKNICVYCGSSPGRQPEYIESAGVLGQAIVRHGAGLVYGGASIGLMGAVADSVLAAGGEVVGIIPESLAALEIAHEGLTELVVVADMHERKAAMADRSDGFIAMPGGLGTLEELYEMLTWSQLGFHQKPCAVLNVASFYDQLLAFMDVQQEQGFMKPEHRQLLLADADPASLIKAMDTWTPYSVAKV